MPQFTSSVLEQYGRDVFTAAGSPPDIADAVARSLVLADLSGHPSHGVMRIPDYVSYIDEDLVDPRVRPSVRQATANAVLWMATGDSDRSRPPKPWPKWSSWPRRPALPWPE